MTLSRRNQCIEVTGGHVDLPDVATFIETINQLPQQGQPALRTLFAETAVRHIAQQYAAQTGHTPQIFRGSSPGAVAFGHLHHAKAHVVR